MQLHEASFAVMDWMLHIAATEGRMPNIGVHSIAGCGQGQVSVWLELDDPNANEGMGHGLPCRCKRGCRHGSQ